MLIPKWFWPGVGATLACAVMAAALIHGQRQHQAGYLKAKQEMAAALAGQAQKQREAAMSASKDYQAARAVAEQKEKVRYVEVQKIVERPVYIGDCLDDDGLSVLNAAIADGNTAARGFGAALPCPTRFIRHVRQGGVALGGGGSSSVQRLPAAASGVGGGVAEVGSRLYNTWH